MTQPNNFVEQLARHLQDHPIQDGGNACGCGEWRAWTKDGSPNGCYEEHVAAAAVEALQLTEEWTVEFSEPAAYAKPQARPPSLEIVQRTRDFFPGREWVSRLVGPWVRVEQP